MGFSSKTPHERLCEFLDSYTEEDLAAIARKVADPGYVPEPVELREDSDPFGRDWDWLELERAADLPENPDPFGRNWDWIKPERAAAYRDN